MRGGEKILTPSIIELKCSRHLIVQVHWVYDDGTTTCADYSDDDDNGDDGDDGDNDGEET